MPPNPRGRELSDRVAPIVKNTYEALSSEMICQHIGMSAALLEDRNAEENPFDFEILTDQMEAFIIEVHRVAFMMGATLGVVEWERARQNGKE